MDATLALFVLFFFIVAFIFGVAFGGFFLMAAVWLFNELGSAGRERREGKTEESGQVFKTTDAGPYTAPGVVSAPSDPEPTERNPPSQSLLAISYPYACWITFCVLVSIALITFGLQEFLFSLDRKVAGTMNQYFALFALPLALSIAVAFHTSMLQTTLLRGVLITLMLLLPWGALLLAVAAICMR